MHVEGVVSPNNHPFSSFCLWTDHFPAWLQYRAMSTLQTLMLNSKFLVFVLISALLVSDCVCFELLQVDFFGLQQKHVVNITLACHHLLSWYSKLVSTTQTVAYLCIQQFQSNIYVYVACIEYENLKI